MMITNENNMIPNKIQSRAHEFFAGELVFLHTDILKFATLISEQILDVLESFQPKNENSFQRIITRKSQIDLSERKIVNTISEILSKQPKAQELRIVAGFSKAMSDLKRLCEEATQMTCFSVKIKKHDHNHLNTEMLREIHIIGNYAYKTLQSAIESLDTFDLHNTRKILMHTDLDNECYASLRRLTSHVLEDTLKINNVINIILVQKSLEAINTYAQNLAEDILYIAKCKDIWYNIAH